MLRQFAVLVIIAYFSQKHIHWYYKLSVDHADSEYDFVIVGGGTTGNVIANRLTEIPHIKVLVIEAGGEDSPNPLISVPFLAPLIQLTSANWNYKTETQNHSCKAMNDQQSAWPRGKMLGGSSSINYMIYARGSKHDFDKWERAGATGWSYENVLPYFMKSEKYIGDDNNKINIDRDYHGYDGPLKTSAAYSMGVSQYIFNGLEALGFKSTDYNGMNIFGFSNVQTTIFNSVRQNSATAFLRTVIYKRKMQLHILTHSHVRKIIFSKDVIKGENKAVGVIYVRDGKEYHVKVKKEVILSAGSIETPKLLMLSGLGPKAHITGMNVSVIADLPGVGSNLQDHIMSFGCFKAKLPRGAVFNMFNPIDALHGLYTYLFQGTGPLSSPGSAGSSFFMTTTKNNNSTKLGLRPDLQYFILEMPLPTNFAGHIFFSAINQREVETNYMRAWSAKYNDPFICDFFVNPVLLHPGSTGSIRLKSNNFLDPPKINPNYLTSQHDVETLIEGFRLLEKLEKTDPFIGVDAKLNLYFPECFSDGIKSPMPSKFYECVIRHHTWTAYHPVGSAKMGSSSDEMAVVDPRLKVYKVSSLRIADASVMPELPSANPQAACYMIGEKAADMIKEDWNLL